jgi:hypothetical protein
MKSEANVNNQYNGNDNINENKYRNNENNGINNEMKILSGEIMAKKIIEINGVIKSSIY